jgi:hypothetical protein
VRGEGVKCGNGDGAGDVGDDGQEVLSEETAVQGVGTVLDEVVGLQAVRALDDDVGKGGIGGDGVKLEYEGGGEG